MKRKTILLVDGYNILNAMEGGIDRPIADARDALTEKLADYAGFSGQRIVLVYDAWMSRRLSRTEEEHGPVTVVYTRKGETADHYIERCCGEWAEDAAAGRIRLRVATSDGVEQTLVLGRGAERVSAREILLEIAQTRAKMPGTTPAAGAKSTLMDRLPREIREKLEALRRGEGTKR